MRGGIVWTIKFTRLMPETKIIQNMMLSFRTCMVEVVPTFDDTTLESKKSGFFFFFFHVMEALVEALSRDFGSNLTWNTQHHLRVPYLLFKNIKSNNIKH